jgi:6-pyruvoyltetrahydropterin/6-carboxytetrahydropterin synthase
MLELSRTIRFCLSHDGTLASDAPADNTYAAWPPMRGLGRYYELTVTCRGEVDPMTGFFMNIKRIDEAARAAALPLVARAAGTDRAARLGELLRDMMQALGRPLDQSVTALELGLTPTYSLRIESGAMDQALITQRYEFSAAHRLHAEELSAQENRRVFGKCNNPAGHGHNYHLEVTVRGPIGADGCVAPIEHLDALVNRAVIEKLDHKHLDQDVPQFASLNTTVENIARVIYGELREPLAGAGLELDQVRVWETGKTVCTYRG